MSSTNIFTLYEKENSKQPILRRKMRNKIESSGDDGGKIPETIQTTPEGGGGGFIGFFKRIWYWLIVHLIGAKWSAIELCSKHRTLNLESIGQRKGEVAIVTGGARGIGAEVTKKLLKLDYHVIIGCRSTSAGQEMISKLREEGLKSGTVECLQLDLTSFASVRQFANIILKRDTSINLLFNNAGIMFVPFKLTEDGCESQFQVNYLSHFLLTKLLIPKLVSAGSKNNNSRIINVSSCASYGGNINFQDLQMKKLYSSYMAYMTSKLMQVVFSNYLDMLLKDKGVNVRSYSLHPGVVQTELYDNIWWVQTFSFLVSLFFKTPDQGSDTVCYTGLSQDLENQGGIFLANSQKTAPNNISYDVSIQKRLWEESCEVSGVEKSL